MRENGLQNDFFCNNVMLYHVMVVYWVEVGLYKTDGPLYPAVYVLTEVVGVSSNRYTRLYWVLRSWVMLYHASWACSADKNTCKKIPNNVSLLKSCSLVSYVVVRLTYKRKLTYIRWRIKCTIQINFHRSVPFHLSSSQRCTVPILSLFTRGVQC